MVVLPTDVTLVQLLTHGASLVNPKLGLVRRPLPTVLAGDNGIFSPTDGADMLLTMDNLSTVVTSVRLHVQGTAESLQTVILRGTP